VIYQKALFLDMVILQQDAFDTVDAGVPMDRQKLVLDRIWAVVERQPSFEDKTSVRHHYNRLMGLFKNFHYAAPDSPDYQRLLGEIDAMIG
jgi:V/A-type H+-transporting ATPase subunit A